MAECEIEVVVPRRYSELIDAFEDTQLVIDIYNDAKKNVAVVSLCYT